MSITLVHRETTAKWVIAIWFKF